ncbi:MAG: hypothetical protein E6I37_06855, partial [Chloroflexi bacterium]
ADAVARNPQTVQNARLWDPQLALPQTLENIQSLRTYYQFYPNEVAVDRYQLGGQYLQLLLAARELKPENLPPEVKNWVNLKLQYTHGYGVVAARANEATTQGYPVLTLKDIPPAGTPEVTQPGIYFGRHTTDYVLADSKQFEFDYPLETDKFTHWTGHTGVPLTSGLRSLAFAVRFGDINMLISPQLTAQTQVLFNRAVQDRVAALAPFLRFDQDPYVVVVDGRVYWILDGFTVTDHYPYSEMAPDQGGAFYNVNYARNSVKVVVDAYDGTTTFYQIDPKDAIANTYGAIFPGLLKPFSQMPAGLQAHIRYPRDLFNLQAERFTLFHMTDPRDFFSRLDLWNIAKENQQQASGPLPMRPFYVVSRLPGESKVEFVTILPYTPNGKTTGLRNSLRFPLPQGQPGGRPPASGVEHRSGPGDQVAIRAAQCRRLPGNSWQPAGAADREFPPLHRADLPGGDQRPDSAAEESDRRHRPERGDGGHARQGARVPAR